MLSKDLLFLTIHRIELAAKLTMLERERASLSRRLRSPLLSHDHGRIAIERIGQAQIEWHAIKQEIEATRSKAPALSQLDPHGSSASVHLTSQ